MQARVRAIAARQGGVFTRQQAIEAGFAPDRIRQLSRPSGPWLLVRRGVYAERELWDSLDEHVGRPLLVDRAAHLRVSSSHLMSHDSAARALAVPFLHYGSTLVHVTREGVAGSRTHRGVKHHLTRLGLLNTGAFDGMPVTGIARTVVDLGREHGCESGVVAADHALNIGFDEADLTAEIAVMSCWPGVTEARAAVELARTGSESPGESLTRVVLEGLALGDIDVQFPVRISDRVAWVDLRIGCHLIEFDGRTKFRRAELGGVADRPVEDLLWDERQRQQEICARGLGMSRVIWDELFGVRRTRLEERLRREYAVTRARFGDVLPEHLAREAAEIRARSPRRPRPL